MKFVLKVAHTLFLSMMIYQMTVFAAQSGTSDKDDKKVQAYTLDELQKELQELFLSLKANDNSQALFLQILTREEQSLQKLATKKKKAAYALSIKSEAKKLRYEVLKNEIKKEKDVISIITLGSKGERGLKENIKALDDSFFYCAAIEWNIYGKILLYVHLYLSFVKNFLKATQHADEELNACLKRVLAFIHLIFRQMEESHQELFTIISESQQDQSFENFIRAQQGKIFKKNRHSLLRVIKTLEELIEPQKAGSKS